MEGLSTETQFFKEYFEVVVGIGAVVFFSAVTWNKIAVLEEKVKTLFELINNLKQESRPKGE